MYVVRKTASTYDWAYFQSEAFPLDILDYPDFEEVTLDPTDTDDVPDPTLIRFVALQPFCCVRDKSDNDKIVSAGYGIGIDDFDTGTYELVEQAFPATASFITVKGNLELVNDLFNAISASADRVALAPMMADFHALMGLDDEVAAEERINDETFPSGLSATKTSMIAVFD